MGSFSGKFDPDAKAPTGFDTFPAGTYNVEMTEGEIKPTAAGTGELFKHRFRVIDGEHEGRLIFGQMNLQNPNPTAQEIGQGEFKALREVVGVLDPDDPEDLCFKSFPAVVKIKAAKGDFEARNEINWGATYKLFKGGAAPTSKPANDNVRAANDNKPGGAAIANKPWPSRNAA